MIEVRYKGRLGNNLFQYCLGRILAEELGFALKANPIPGFPKTGQPVEAAAYAAPRESLSGQRVPLGSILANCEPRHIILDGWFQRFEYYHPYRERIRNWLSFDTSVRQPEVDADLVVHVRRNDYVQLGWALPFSFYEEAIECLLPRGGQVWIGTDDPGDPFFRKFRRWKPRFFRGNAAEQFLLMTRARRLVMSQSTFSWWPTFLSHDQEVVCPVPSFGCWAHSAPDSSSGINLIEPDRFVCVPCDAPYLPSETERRYQQRRLLKRRFILTMNRRLGWSLDVPPQ